MAMIHTNLTPFFWGPKVTSVNPPQVQMTVCVRGVFRLEPGAPVEPIEDLMQQGFMSGDVFAPDDLDQTGALLHASDFADWKPNTDLLLTGTAYPPGGGVDVACPVRFGVDDWSKTLYVVGPRRYVPGMLVGGHASVPEPFVQMPLTWEHAYGGPDYPQNPVGRGHTSYELPCVVEPGQQVAKRGATGITPAGFGPISPRWPPRAGKLGRKYGAAWKRSRAPFYAEDFDWTYFNAAPADQQLERYLRGDEELSFQNLHPAHPVWTARLPGLRVRAFARGADDVVHEPLMALDTLCADLDAGRLVLVWRGLVPIRELDMSDVHSVLIASESLDAAPLPAAHYHDLLAAFEADPVGLDLPPGFLEAGEALEAARQAELAGEPGPDLTQVAEALPAGCPIPPWFLAAAAGASDPLGVRAQMPESLFSDDPLGLAERLPAELATQEQRDALALSLQKVGQGEDAQAQAEALEEVAALLPPEQAQALRESLGQARQALAEAEQAGAPGLLQQAAQAARAASPAKPGAQLAALQAEGASQLAALPAGLAAPRLPSTPSLDAVIGKLLLPLDTIELPEVDVPDVEGELAARKAALVDQEQALRAQGIDHPLLGLFAWGQRLIDKAPRPETIPTPDLGPLVAGLDKLQRGLLGQGVALAALAPLTRLIQRVTALQDALPEPAGASGQDLQGQDLSGQDLRGRCFVGANLSEADLSGADLREANLTDADLSNANLRGADLSGASLEQVNAAGVCLAGARLVGANLRFVQLDKADLRGADASGADLSLAALDAVRADELNLSGATLDMTTIAKSRLRGASLRGATSAMGSFDGCDLSEADLRDCRFMKVSLMGAVLDGANLDGAALRQANLRDVRATGARFVKADLQQSSATGQAAFRDCAFVSLQADRSVWMDVDLAGSDFSYASLRDAQFMGASAEGVSFYAARLKGAGFRRAQLTRASFVRADLCHAQLNRATLLDSQFTGANCYDAKFLSAELASCDFQEANLTRALFDEPGRQGVTA